MAAVIEIPKEVIKEEDRESGVYRFNVQQYGRMLEAGVICEDDRLELIEGRHYSILSVEPSITRTGGLSGSFGKRVSKEMTYDEHESFSLIAFPEISIKVGELLPPIDTELK